MYDSLNNIHGVFQPAWRGKGFRGHQSNPRPTAEEPYGSPAPTFCLATTTGTRCATFHDVQPHFRHFYLVQSVLYVEPKPVSPQVDFKVRQTLNSNDCSADSSWVTLGSCSTLQAPGFHSCKYRSGDSYL